MDILPSLMNLDTYSTRKSMETYEALVRYSSEVPDIYAFFSFSSLTQVVEA
jgi:hypothetical protein